MKLPRVSGLFVGIDEFFYPQRCVFPMMKSAAHDAETLGKNLQKTLKQQGEDASLVRIETNVTKAEFYLALEDFIKDVCSKMPEILIFYFAGHVLKCGEEGSDLLLLSNFLGVDDELSLKEKEGVYDVVTLIDDFFKDERLNDVLKVIICDADRNQANPMQGVASVFTKRLVPGSLPKNTFVVFSCEAFKEARKYGEVNSPFCKALLEHIFCVGKSLCGQIYKAVKHIRPDSENDQGAKNFEDIHAGGLVSVGYAKSILRTPDMQEKLQILRQRTKSIRDNFERENSEYNGPLKMANHILSKIEKFSGDKAVTDSDHSTKKLNSHFSFHPISDEELQYVQRIARRVLNDVKEINFIEDRNDPSNIGESNNPCATSLNSKPEDFLIYSFKDEEDCDFEENLQYAIDDWIDEFALILWEKLNELHGANVTKQANATDALKQVWDELGRSNIFADELTANQLQNSSQPVLVNDPRLELERLTCQVDFCENLCNLAIEGYFKVMHSVETEKEGCVSFLRTSHLGAQLLECLLREFKGFRTVTWENGIRLCVLKGGAHCLLLSSSVEGEEKYANCRISSRYTKDRLWEGSTFPMFPQLGKRQNDLPYDCECKKQRLSLE